MFPLIHIFLSHIYNILLFLAARSCGTIAAAASLGCTTAEVFGIKTDTCFCKGDACNTATLAKVSYMSMIAVITLPIAVFY